jgi:GNAT superfamily N-acetyltransferase
VTGPDPVGLETVEAAAIADAFGADAVRVGGAVCALRADIDEVFINRVIGLGVTEPAAATTLDRIADVFGSVRHSVALAPGAQPPGLPDMLRERGYEAGYAWVKFQRPAATPHEAATDLRVERIGAERAADYVAVIAAGFGLPPEAAAMLEHLPGRPGWGCYLAYAGEAPVAAGAVFVSGEYAWLGQATTLPEHRRRGGQSALMAARIGEARAAGATVVVTETGETIDGRPANSYHNILRAGFEPAYVRPNFISPPEDAIA